MKVRPLFRSFLPGFHHLLQVRERFMRTVPKILNSLDCLGLGVLAIDGRNLLVADALNTGSAESAVEANLGVDLLHALLVSRSNTARSEDQIHFFKE